MTGLEGTGARDSMAGTSNWSIDDDISDEL